jgi:hypothetical protein
MTTVGQAMRMKVELARLVTKHGVAPSPPVTIPLAPPVDGPVILSGYCSTPHVDLERVRFRPFALGWLPWRMPLLCHRHGAVEVGEIHELAYTDNGSLRIRCTVRDDAAALCNAFSVTATVYDYELVNVDSSHFHAVVKSGWLDEVSLTTTPANPQALVDFRCRGLSTPPFHTLMQRRIACCLGLLDIVKTTHASAPARDEPPPRVRPRSDFSTLVEQINSGVDL